MECKYRSSIAWKRSSWAACSQGNPSPPWESRRTSCFVSCRSQGGRQLCTHLVLPVIKEYETGISLSNRSLLPRNSHSHQSSAQNHAENNALERVDETLEDHLLLSDSRNLVRNQYCVWRKSRSLHHPRINATLQLNAYAGTDQVAVGDAGEDQSRPFPRRLGRITVCNGTQHRLHELDPPRPVNATSVSPCSRSETGERTPTS